LFRPPSLKEEFFGRLLTIRSRFLSDGFRIMSEIPSDRESSIKSFPEGIYEGESSFFKNGTKYLRKSALNFG